MARLSAVAKFGEAMDRPIMITITTSAMPASRARKILLIVFMLATPAAFSEVVLGESEGDSFIS
jgi:hypothetical protein